MKQLGRVWTTRLQEDCDSVRVGETSNDGLISRGQRLQNPQHECIDIVGTRDLDLRQPVPHTQPRDQRTQLWEESRNPAWQYCTARHIRHETTAPFMEAN